MEKYPCYFAGRFYETEQHTEVRNPYNGQLVGRASLANPDHLDEAINAAQKALPETRSLPSWKRYNILMEVSKAIESQQQRIASVLASEAAKPIRLALAEVARSAEIFRIAAEESKRLPKEYLSLDWTSGSERKEGLVKYFPIGLVAGISPFNFPLNLAVHKIAPAIAAGCPIILKPATATPLTSLELARILRSTYLPAGAVAIMPMDRTTGSRLVTDERFAMLSFTGSPEVGWKMKQQSGKKKVVLELGGNAGVIISDDCNLELALKRCIYGAFAYAGQVCIHTQRIFVQQKLFDRFTERFVQMAAALKAGDPLDPTTEITSMIDLANATRVEEWIMEARQSGAQILTGGKREGAFVMPTVITNTQPEMKVRCLEAFGPVVTLEQYESFEQAIELVNNSRFGLQAGVFTNRINEMDQAFNTLEVGGVIINDVPTFRVDHMPYGGVKESGLGREGVKYAIAGMMEPRILVKDF